MLHAVDIAHQGLRQVGQIPFAEKAGITPDIAWKMAANFGGGMRRAAACGAITGGLMVLGLFGVDDIPTVIEFHKRFKENHEGALECAELLQKNKEKGMEKKAHCDSMVFESVMVVETILREKGKI